MKHSPIEPGRRRQRGPDYAGLLYWLGFLLVILLDAVGAFTLLRWMT